MPHEFSEKRVEMRALLLFLLAALGCSLTEGRLVSKCELRDELTSVIGDLPEQAKRKGLTVENLVAKIVCHAEVASGFNTSAVNQLTSESGEHHSGENSRERNIRDKRHARRTQSNTGTPHDDDAVWTLYGLFQLSNHLVCSDGTNPSPNICDMDCNDLLDDDIHDDMNCLLQIFTNLVDNGFGAAHWEELKKMIRLIYQRGCRDKNASEYFAECL
uniref:lysozyme C, milk isozyme n=1 Tax=Scatophagus argus TaxID=75038 RepID=UPI001ED80BF2|nr:lysozyme C, milk isozyme [Scatophagus argus]